MAVLTLVVLGLLGFCSWVLARVMDLHARIELLENAVRRIAPANQQIGGAGQARVAVSVPVSLSVNGTHHGGELVDLSPSGAQCRLSAPVEVGQVLTISLGDEQRGLSCRAKVIRALSGGVGLSFVVPDRRFAGEVKRLCDQARRGGRQR